ncbi:hypothetical protein FXO38_08639 [Capsicum annuum]|uniref:Uncharacterized protein n=1 Tax=Capsicum annuum TaxID=4072 RepID=A0A2G2YLW7_CAPAN|nr:hypothetical protein FXO37_24131 [Capsicum annuum]KAF3667358.1 hypothetical protein FXO38_08639 [Capsicum annuum]PHT70753.1 hypothetical protein T459_25857 [Capsicum annuum]
MMEVSHRLLQFLLLEKKAWDWSTRAASAHPQKTSPVADDNMVGEHDTRDNELDFIDESDDDLQYDDFDSNVTEMSFPSPAAISPARKNVGDWSTRVASTHPKNTSPVANDDKASKHDAEDNELKEHDADDDKFRVLIFFSKYT